MKLLEDKAVVVTGAGRGIGRGHCLHLAANGAAVVVNDLDAELAAQVVAEISDAGGRALASQQNIASRAGAEALIETCREEFGKIDAIVNNAGNLRDRTFLKMTDEEFDQVWNVHVKGTFWCSQAAALAMRDQGGGGAIVNTTSGAHFGNYGQTNYAAAKGAIASMTYTWSLELARYGIRVNAIAPIGSTRMSATLRDEAKLPEIDPALNGPVAVFLCSNRADNISGQVFGSGGERLSLLVQPHYGKTLLRTGGWDVEAVCEQLPRQLRGDFRALGMLQKPYPWHDGVC